jgi:hypothetical protein
LKGKEMMSDLAGFRTLVRSHLGDKLGVRFEDDSVDAAVRVALRRYSDAYPDLRTGMLTVTALTAGREISLVAFTRLLDVAEVDYPYNAALSDIPKCKRWYFYWKDAIPYLYFSGSKVPANGEVIRVIYYSAHQIDALNGATATSVRTLHEQNLALGAASMVVLQHSLELAGAYGGKSRESDKLQKWGQDLQLSFDTWLGKIGSEKRYPGLPSEGWRVDDLDGEENY